MNKEAAKTILKIFGVLAALYMFLVGINGMSSAIKHMGEEIAESIVTATSNPFVVIWERFHPSMNCHRDWITTFQMEYNLFVLFIYEMRRETHHTCPLYFLNSSNELVTIDL